MRKLLWIIDRLFGHRLAGQTQQQLVELAEAPARAGQRRAATLLDELAAQPGPHVVLGQTEWGQLVKLSLEFLVKAFSIITGGTGSGKTMALLLIADAILTAIIDAIVAAKASLLGFGLLDPKTEFFLKTLFLIAQKLEQLPPAEAEQFRERIVIIDLAASNPLTAYNIAKPWAGSDLDFFATSRVETMGEVLAPGEGLSLRGAIIVKQVLKLLAECGVPFGYIERVLSDEAARAALVSRAKSEEVRDYFRRQFPNESKATLAAVQARLSSALLSTESLRLALSGEDVPDFRRFQDEGKLVLVNCGGANIARPTARVLQALFLSDIRQATFSRTTQTPYLWVLDEGQTFLRTKQLRENMDEMLRLARSFGTFLCLVTQNLTAGASDADLIEVIQTNIKWSLSLRSTPRDAAFLKPALPVTGRMQKPRVNPFAPAEFYTLTEERAVQLEGVAHLPDRVGWLWLKALTGEAIKLRTAPLHIPSGITFTRAVERLRADPDLGQRIARLAYLEALTRREAEWRPERRAAESLDEKSDKLEQLKQRYRKTRGSDE